MFLAVERCLFVGIFSYLFASMSNFSLCLISLTKIIRHFLTSIQSVKTPRKPFLGGPTCYKEDKPPTPSSLIFPAVYPWLDKWYLGYAMASGIFGMRQFEQGEFLLLSVAFHIDSAFAGKVYYCTKVTSTFSHHFC